MKISIEQSELIKAINNVQKAISNKTTIEIHKDIYIETLNNNQIKLIGNDLNLGIETIITAEVKEEGKLTVNSRLFGEIIKKMPSNNINITKKDNNLLITSSSSKFNLKSGNTDEYMKLPKIEEHSELIIDKYILLDMIKQTIFATSNDENRPILNGLLFKNENNYLTMVGLDLYRIAIKQYPLKTNKKEKIVIPTKTLSELYKILNSEETEDEIKIYITEKFIKFSFSNIIIISRLLAGEYIDYQQAIPTASELKINCSRQELYKAVDRASLIASQDNNKSLLFEIEDDFLKITTNSEYGSVNEEIKVKSNGKNLKIGFNTRYWLDILKVLDCDSVNLEFTDSMHPCLVKPDDSDNYSYVIFPVRIVK